MPAKVDSNKCEGHQKCLKVCPTDAIIIKADYKAEVQEELCFGCGVCVTVCPEQAIALED
jgi:hypothetical protein